MPEVEFSEEQTFAESLGRGVKRETSRWSPSKLAVRCGLAKDETGAKIVLAGAALIAAVLAVVVFLAAD